MATNPILTEINSLSPGAKTALMNAHAATSAPQPSPALQTQQSPQSSALISPEQPPAPLKMQAPSSISAAPQMGAAPPPASAPPSHPALSASSPTASQPALGTTAGDEAQRQHLIATPPAVDSIYHNVSTSDFGEKHPFLGKLAGGLAEVGGKIGDTLSNAVPGIGREIPGTTQNHNLLLAQNEQNIGNDLGITNKEATNANLQADVPLKQAQTTGDNLANLNEPQRASDAHAASVAGTANVQSEANARDNPKEDWEPVPGFQGPNGEPLEREKTSGHYRIADIAGAKPIAKPSSMEHVAGVMNGKQTFGNYHADTGVFTDENGQPMHGFQPQPPQTPAGAIVLNPSTAGGYDAQAVRPGSHIAPGAVTVGGMNTMDTPTAQSRNMAEMAKTVLPQMTAISNEVDQMASNLGPSVGRWNDLMVNKGGKDFPAFAKLDTDLDLLASAIVRTHFGGRGGQEYREELRKQFGEAQSPEDLKARIAGANSWLAGYSHMADPQGATPKEGETKVNSAGDKIKFSGGKWGPA